MDSKKKRARKCFALRYDFEDNLISEEDVAWLRALAKAEGRSLRHYVARALQQHIIENGAL